MSPAMNAAAGDGRRPMKMGATDALTRRLLKMPDSERCACMRSPFCSIMRCKNVMRYVMIITVIVVGFTTAQNASLMEWTNPI